MSGRLGGRVALITGGGSGIGRAVVDRFVAEGARVAVLERSVHRADVLRRDFADEVLIELGDTSRPPDNERAVASTVERFGHLDVFVGNAGVYDARVRLDEIHSETLVNGFHHLFDVDVLGYLLGVHAALPQLRRCTDPSIVFTASVSSLTVGFGGAMYVAAKHAVAGLTRQLALELAPDISVNAVAPGYVPTSLSAAEGLAEIASPDSAGRRVTNSLDPVQLAEFYVLFAAAENRSTTGSMLLCDSGISLVGPGPRPPRTHSRPARP